jgi:gamma-glutamyl phosphate reductase
MNFDYLTKEYSKFNIKIVQEIFSNIKKRIESSVGILHNSIEQDNKKYFEKFEYSKLLQTIDRANHEDWIMNKNTKTFMYYGIGNIGVCFKGTTDLVLYLLLKALKTNNNIIFFEENEIHKTSQVLIDIVNEECEKCNYNVCFRIIKYSKITELCNDVDNFNMFIFINKTQEYLKFSSKVQNGMKIICSNYGTMDFYLDDKDLKDTLLEMDEYVYNNNIELEIYKDKNVEDAVKKINNRKKNYCAIIFTKNKENAYYFIKNVKAERIFINKNPASEYNFELSDEELTLCKRIYI